MSAARAAELDIAAAIAAETRHAAAIAAEADAAAARAAEADQAAARAAAKKAKKQRQKAKKQHAQQQPVHTSQVESIPVCIVSPQSTSKDESPQPHAPAEAGAAAAAQQLQDDLLPSQATTQHHMLVSPAIAPSPELTQQTFYAAVPKQDPTSKQDPTPKQDPNPKQDPTPKQGTAAKKASQGVKPTDTKANSTRLPSPKSSKQNGVVSTHGMKDAHYRSDPTSGPLLKTPSQGVKHPKTPCMPGIGALPRSPASAYSCLAVEPELLCCPITGVRPLHLDNRSC